MDDNTHKKSGCLPVLGKNNAILDAFTLTDPTLTLADQRGRTGLPASTAQRLVACRSFRAAGKVGVCAVTRPTPSSRSSARRETTPPKILVELLCDRAPRSWLLTRPITSGRWIRHSPHWGNRRPRRRQRVRQHCQRATAAWRLLTLPWLGCRAPFTWRSAERRL